MATTTGALVQTALNIVAPIQGNIANGVYEDPYSFISDLCGAMVALAEAISASQVAGVMAPSTVIAGVTPNVGPQYSAVQSLTTTPVFTKIR